MMSGGGGGGGGEGGREGVSIILLTFSRSPDQILVHMNR